MTDKHTYTVAVTIGQTWDLPIIAATGDEALLLAERLWDNFGTRHFRDLP